MAEARRLVGAARHGPSPPLLGAWLRLWRRAPEAAARLLVAEAARAADRIRASLIGVGLEVDDVAAELSARLVRVASLGRSPGVGAERVPLRVWLLGMARNVVREAQRRRSRDAKARERWTDRRRAEPTPSDPVEVGELWRGARAWLSASLPPPYRQLAVWQYLEGRSRRELVTGLRKLRKVSVAEARRLIAKTHAMLRCLGAGENPRTRWPRVFDPRVNPWIKSKRGAAKGRAPKG